MTKVEELRERLAGVTHASQLKPIVARVLDHLDELETAFVKVAQPAEAFDKAAEAAESFAKVLDRLEKLEERVSAAYPVPTVEAAKEPASTKPAKSATHRRG